MCHGVWLSTRRHIVLGPHDRLRSLLDRRGSSKRDKKHLLSEEEVPGEWRKRLYCQDMGLWNLLEHPLYQSRRWRKGLSQRYTLPQLRHLHRCVTSMYSRWILRIMDRTKEGRMTWWSLRMNSKSYHLSRFSLMKWSRGTHPSIWLTLWSISTTMVDCLQSQMRVSSFGTSWNKRGNDYSVTATALSSTAANFLTSI